jgi:hypothetical protein
MHPMSVHLISSNILLMDLKSYVDSNTVVVGDFNSCLSLIDWSSKPKSIKKF